MRAGWGALIVLVGSGCGLFEPSAPAWTPSPAMESSARMLRQLDQIESELHNANAENVLYSELVERHGEAQQIACNVTDEHVQEIHRLALAQERKMEQKRAKRRAVAMARASKKKAPRKAAASG
jgi:hypothetical protein